MLINKNWSLQTTFEMVNVKYYPGGIQSGPQRNRLIETWGQLVGKSRSLSELNSLIREYGSINKMSKSVQMAPRTIKTLRVFFESLPDEFETLTSRNSYKFNEGEKCILEEDLYNEFKEIKGQNPTKSVQNIVDEYILAFLNSSGGSIFWGIQDNGVVKSLRLNSQLKDEIRKSINIKINTIEPSIDPTRINVIFHGVVGTNDGYVLEVRVPKSNLSGLHFNSSGHTWVRVNGCKQKLQGVALQDYIIQRLQR
ncbi:ATP-binding protein [Aeromonas hydrophila]|uniref:ATP-binding protein n=1 Tax=Aeromonas hydrophila TaxID=644 RepID=A0AAD3YL41_AERHY|nr:ATP-binding protein [Aeromonas hydrophila]EIS3738785.1 ATP-binding protein [Aeromonas hydrophila]WGY34005.1 ATP-binding protein [Aeromonas hydrophila]HAT6345800.1 ATP-binding protein [Aeromonas hydrophila]HDC4324563.1 ATP-binding protein [Aeromonas hydrophila]